MPSSHIFTTLKTRGRVGRARDITSLQLGQFVKEVKGWEEVEYQDVELELHQIK